MRIYHYDPNGYFVTEGVAQEDPCSPGRYLIPAKATTKKPPTKSHVFDGRAWVPPKDVPEISIQTVREQAITRVLQHAEQARLALLTPGDGKAYVYQAKLAEANAYVAATNPQDSDYPILAAEANALDITIANLAATVCQRAAEIAVGLARIEATAQATKAQITAARSVATIKKILTRKQGD
ncbi:MAG: hypothetical protein AAF442_09280 [Pseudomonadota bacterium]